MAMCPLNGRNSTVVTRPENDQSVTYIVHGCHDKYGNMEVDKDDKVLTAEKPPIAERRGQKDVEPGPLSPGEQDLEEATKPAIEGSSSTQPPRSPNHRMPLRDCAKREKSTTRAATSHHATMTSQEVGAQTANRRRSEGVSAAMPDECEPLARRSKSFG